LGLRTFLKRQLGRVKSFWGELKQSSREGYQEGLQGSQSTPAAPTGSDEQQTFSTSDLSCEKIEVSIDATIDYVDKWGNETRRDITTEEVYEYEDGVLVIRAYCHRRKDYRTFVSKRIRHWVNANSGKPVEIAKLRKEIRWYADLDLNNIALNIGDRNFKVLDFYIGKFTRNFYTSRTGRKYYRMPASFDRDVIEWEFERSKSDYRLQKLNAQQIEEVKDLMFKNRREEGKRKCSGVDESAIFFISNILKGSDLKTRKEVIAFAEKLLFGMPEKASVVQTLSDTFLDPSFKITRTEERDKVVEKEYEERQKRNAEEKRKKEIKEFLEQQEFEKGAIVADIKEQSAQAEKKLEKAARTTTPKSKKRKRVSRLTSELNVVRNLARNECQTQLLQNLANGVMVFEKKPFEEEIRKRVCALLTDKEINKYADLLLPYLGNGIHFGYLDVGLKKKNRGWYLNEDGVVVIDLNNINHD